MANILIVEDNPDILEECASLVRRLGHEVTTATHYRAAMLLLQEHEYDLIISDNQMPRFEREGVKPGMGEEIFRWIRRGRYKNPNVPFILQSGDDEPACIQELGGVYRHKLDGRPLRQLIQELLPQ
jgi:CheY-like chemotaxis protein